MRARAAIPMTLLGTAYACLAVAFAQAPPPDKPWLQASPEQLEWWREARFGLFIHWGPVSLKGTEIGWSRGGDRRGRTGTGTIPYQEYDSLYKQFNPVKFNADEWVAIAQAAGMKYLVFTTKHHDGFCMFDTKLTDYKITNSPFGRDVTRELADACHRAGLRLGFYYSPPDWYDPDYRTERHDRYIQYLHGHLRELCTNYGKVDILWFDGLGGKPEDWDSENLFRLIRRLQPEILINNRAGLPGDFDTPEQRIGKFQINRPWESCITIGRQWAWKPNDQIKSVKECVQTLVRCAGGDGNLLLNVGPMPTGEIEPRQVDVLKGIGEWLAKYGESIYGTRGGPFRPMPWGVSTHKDKTVYVHILAGTADEPSIVLPPLPNKIVSSKLLAGGTPTVKQTDTQIEIAVPPASRDEADTIVALELDAPLAVADIAPTWGQSLTTGKRASASNVFQKNPAYGPDKAVDADLSTRWATDAGVKQAWLEVDLGEATAFDRAFISEEYDRVREFELQYKDGEQWKTFHRGTTIGQYLMLKFAPVSARFVRLNVLKATDGPTIWEFQLMGQNVR